METCIQDPKSSNSNVRAIQIDCNSVIKIYITARMLIIKLHLFVYLFIYLFIGVSFVIGT